MHMHTTETRPHDPLRAGPGLSLTVDHFGTLPDGRPVEAYTFGNSRQLSATVLSYGGILQSLRAPDADGVPDELVLGFDTLNEYVDHSPYFGALIGRFANRIAGGRFSLDGTEYVLARNDGPNNLHGGPEGLDRRLWRAGPIAAPDRVGVALVYLSPDGEMGFPGTAAIMVRYTLDRGSDLRIEYTATCDRDTVLNLTNHSYFNLAGAGSGTVEEHELTLNAPAFTPVDDTLIPTGEIRSVAGTALDFRSGRTIGEGLAQGDGQMRCVAPGQGGYDFNFVLGDSATGGPAARVRDPRSGRVLEMFTSEPGVQLYSGNFLNGIRGRNGRRYEHWGALTLEAQHFPDSPNRPEFPPTLLRAGERYTQTTVYRLTAPRNPARPRADGTTAAG